MASSLDKWTVSIATAVLGGLLGLVGTVIGVANATQLAAQQSKLQAAQFEASLERQKEQFLQQAHDQQDSTVTGLIPALTGTDAEAYNNAVAVLFYRYPNERQQFSRKCAMQSPVPAISLLRSPRPTE